MSKKKCPEFENHERWLVSYADMLTLLFAVFVVLYALNLKPDSSTEAVAGSMQESFSKPLDDIPVERRIGPTEAGFGIFDHFSGNTAKPPLARSYPGAPQAIKTIDKELDRLKRELEERLYGPTRYQGSNKTGHPRIVEIYKTSEGINLRLIARHFYPAGGYKLRRSALKDLDEIGKLLKKMGRKITIVGHSDSMPPPRGSIAETNWEMSALRATHIVRYLVDDLNFPATNISAAGMADTQPIAHNGTKGGRSLNRRIEVKIKFDPENSSDPY